MGLVHCSRDPQTSFFNKTFIKNGSHGIIHTFKNYFATVFSIFNFQQNKWYPNTPVIFVVWDDDITQVQNKKPSKSKERTPLLHLRWGSFLKFRTWNPWLDLRHDSTHKTKVREKEPSPQLKNQIMALIIKYYDSI